MTTTLALSGSPLAVTLDRVGALSEGLTAELGPLDAGWLPAAALLDPDSPELAEALAQSVARYPGAEPRVSGAFFINTYAWYMPAVAIAAYLAAGRVPDLTPENVALRYQTYTWHYGDESGESERIDVRFLSGRFATLPNDPAADHPDALILPDAEALRDWLRTGLEAHLAPLIEAVAARTHLGRRAQWTLAADDIAALFLHIGKQLGDEARGRAEGLALVKADASPLCNPNTSYVTVEAGGCCESFLARGGCCLYYRLHPGENCTTCVLRPAAERDQLLRDYLARKQSIEVPA